ncbi:MAG: UDP-N-acetylmuramate dehydrogenase, partial [Candidatus Aminicenantes bacterium]|nr:UDP-N-acetylmuramate dehydrogenase [Candidatus Aminicenantes bacterium]
RRTPAGGIINMKELQEYLDNKKLEYNRDAEIRPYVTLRIGGPVRFIVVARSPVELEELLFFLHETGSPFVLLGGGSNVLFSGNAPGLVVVVNKSGGISQLQGNILKAGSGLANNELLSWNSAHNAGGIEFLAGIPGTIGGAAAVNAGAFGNSIGAILQGADIFSAAGEIKRVDRDYFCYSYRDSVFKYSNEVILSVYLKFEPAENAEIKSRIKANLKYRQENHPAFRVFTAGCFFKNPVVQGEKRSAGKLIENSGFRGSSFRDLLISAEHANFLINRGGANFADVEDFAGRICGRVLADSGIRLEREVIYISPDGKKY